MKNVWLFLVMLVLGGVKMNSLFAQPLFGLTEVHTLSRNEYGGGAQNWAMATDYQNRLYVANNEGLLVFNGLSWKIFPVPNRTILRSIAFGPEGRLFAGAQDELGYFSADAEGNLRYTSLKELIPAAYRSFTDVWQIVVFNEEVFFRTDKAIFRYFRNQITAYSSSFKWNSLIKIGQQLLAQSESIGLMKWQNNDWVNLVSAQRIPDQVVFSGAVALHPDTSLLTSEGHGLFYLTKGEIQPFKIAYSTANGLNSATSIIQLSDQSFLIGTYYNGLYHVSKSGVILENIGTRNGLRNLTVRCLTADRSGYIWVGLDNGLAGFSLKNPIQHLNPSAFNNGVGYDVQLHQNRIFFALSTGIFSTPFHSSSYGQFLPDRFSMVKNGLTWRLSVVDSILLAGRDDGLWQLGPNVANRVAAGTGFWAAYPFQLKNERLILAGNYLGLQVLKNKNGGLMPILGVLPKFSESSRYLVADQNLIWVSHPYRGVYRIAPEKGVVKLFTHKEGLPADLNNHVFKIRNKVVVATSEGIYEYDARHDRMMRARYFDSIFGKTPIRYLREDAQHNIWFVQDKMVGVVDFGSSKPSLRYLPELKNRVASGFENIFPIDSNHVFIGSDEGFYHVNYAEYKKSIRPFSAYLNQVRSIGKSDSVWFGGFRFDSVGKITSPTIPYAFNSLFFGFAATAIQLGADVEFSYKLEGFDREWSDWTRNSEKEFTNLPAGTYTLYLKARKSPYFELAVSQFSFTIAPPFYQTIWAYFIYSLLALGSVGLLLNFQSRKYRKRQEARRQADLKKFEAEQQQMAYQHQLQLEKSEKEFIKLQKDKLESEIEHKNAELASITMNLVQKKEFILKLKAELQQLQKITKVADDQPELKKLLKTLGEEEKLNKEWDQFAQHFDSVYGDFLSRLRSRFPGLKPHELQLCAYLRMNLTSKEIAPLMSISIRGVEIGRYRLRKKLNLSTEDNLAQFLMDIGKNEAASKST